MRALVKTKMDDDNLYLKDVVERKLKPDEVKIRVLAAGICGTDLYIRKGGGMNIHTPVTLGHEFCGEIVETGDRVLRWKSGDKVTAEPPAETCGICEFCIRRMPALCNGRLSIGSAVDGAFAEYLVIPETRLHSVPEGIDCIDAAMLEPLACCSHAALEIADIHIGEDVLITGPGPMGLLIGQIVKASGGRVFLAGMETDIERLKLAEYLGIDKTVVLKRGQDKVFSDTAEGWDFNCCFECSGAEAGIKMCIDSVRKRGTVIQVGVLSLIREIDLCSLMKKEITLKGSFGSTHFSWEKAIRLLERKLIQVRPLVTEVLPLDQWEKGFGMMESKSACKVILIP